MADDTSKYLPCPIQEETNLSSAKYDGIILVSWPGTPKPPKPFTSVLETALHLDKGLETETAVLPIPELPAKRLVHAPTGPIDPDYHDVRVFREAANRGVQRALKAGIKKPLLVLQQHPKYETAALVTLLGALESLYVPLEVRESSPNQGQKVEFLGVWMSDQSLATAIISQAMVLESGLFIARDIGGSDPERMAPPRVIDYLREVFKKDVKLTIIEDEETLAKNYPLFEAVNRGASVIPRHRGGIVLIEYGPVNSSHIKNTVYLVGKGVTYDTGGADIKAGGIMAGMSRDKCGAAAVAGFMQIVRTMKPRDLKVVGALSLVRNSVGANCYVSDEIITARSGARVRVGNTDAEGRMVMADVLCQMKEFAVNAVNPHLYTIATLTGHACLSVGNYSIVVDNGPARFAHHASALQESGERIGDPFEVSSMRRDDLNFHRGKAQGDDLLQCNNLPSSRTPRGHQGPAAFLLLAAGLEKHGSADSKPLKFSHLDVAGSAGSLPDNATGAPILALVDLYLLR